MGRQGHLATTPPRGRIRAATVVEILVVVLLVGVLAAVATPILMAQERKAVDAALKLDLRAVAAQIELLPAGERVTFAAPTLTLGADELTLSPGTVPRIFRKGRGAFCIQLTNPGGSDPARGYVWTVDGGGPQPAGRTCAGYRSVVL